MICQVLYFEVSASLTLLSIKLILDGKNEFHLNEQTRFYDVQVQELVERLKNIKDGSEILFKTTIKDSKDIIIGIKPTLAPSGSISTRYWTYVDERLAAIGVTPKQVQVVWIKQADAGPAQGSPDYAKTLQSELSSVLIHKSLDI
jgi:hypothetical protein